MMSVRGQELIITLSETQFTEMIQDSPFGGLLYSLIKEGSNPNASLKMSMHGAHGLKVWGLNQKLPGTYWKSIKNGSLRIR